MTSLGVLNFNDNFDPRLSIIERVKPAEVKYNPKTPIGKKSGRKLSDYNTEKTPSSTKKQPIVTIFPPADNFSQASISTKANETINFKLDDSFMTVSGHSTSVLSSESAAQKNKNTGMTKGKLTNDKIVFIKNQFKNESASFNCYDIGDEGAKVISELLAKNSKVKELKLTKTNIGDEGASFIFKALETNNSISNFNISKNVLTDKSIDSILNFLKNNKIVKTFNIASNQLSSQVKEKIKSTARTNFKMIL